jgi:hypothetical protein
LMLREFKKVPVQLDEIHRCVIWWWTGCGIYWSVKNAGIPDELGRSRHSRSISEAEYNDDVGGRNLHKPDCVRTHPGSKINKSDSDIALNHRFTAISSISSCSSMFDSSGVESESIEDANVKLS